MPETRDAERPLLPHLPPSQRGPTMNRFLDPVRTQQCTDPEAIVAAVVVALRTDVIRRLPSRPHDPLREVLHAILHHPTEALALAAEAVAYHALTPEALAAHKARQAEAGQQQYMRTVPPTPKQLDYLQQLGVTTIPANRWDASQLIDAALKGGASRGS